MRGELSSRVQEDAVFNFKTNETHSSVIKNKTTAQAHHAKRKEKKTPFANQASVKHFCEKTYILYFIKYLFKKNISTVFNKLSV